MKRALGLVRVSTISQAEQGYSLEEQTATIQAYCARHGLELVEVVTDAGISGKVLNRPGVVQALQLADAKAYEVLILCRLDRLGRENRVIQELLGRFRDRGVEVQFTEHASGNSPSERFMLNVLGGVSEFESALTRERTMAGKAEKAAGGFYPAYLGLFGYRMIQRWQEQASPEFAGRSGELLPHPEEAPLVTELFRRYADGTSLAQLAAWLTETGISARRGGVWSFVAVRRLLGNSAYVGELVYGRHAWTLLAEQTTAGKRRFAIRERDADEWQIIACPPLVSRETWDAVQARLARNTEALVGRPTTLYSLRGCITCYQCRTTKGEPRTLVGQRRNTNSKRPGYHRLYYKCRDCALEIGAEKLDRQVMQALRAACRPEVAERETRRRVMKQRAAAGTVDADLARVRETLRQLDVEEGRLADLGLAGISVPVLRDKAAGIRKRRARAEAERQRLQEAADQLQDPEEAVLLALNEAADTLEWLAEAEEDMERRQELFQARVRVTAFPKGKCNISFCWRDR